MNICIKSLCGHIYPFLWAKYLEMGLLDHVLGVCLTF